MSIAGDARVLAALLRGQPRDGDHAARLDAFYAPQAPAAMSSIFSCKRCPKRNPAEGNDSGEAESIAGRFSLIQIFPLPKLEFVGKQVRGKAK